MHIARQTIELGDYDRRLQFLGLAKGRGELWALVQGVAALAGLDLDKLTSGLQGLTGDELQNSLALGIQSQAAPTLFVGGNAIVRDNRGHDNCSVTCICSYICYGAKRNQVNLYSRDGQYVPRRR